MKKIQKNKNQKTKNITNCIIGSGHEAINFNFLNNRAMSTTLHNNFMKFNV